MNIIKYLVKLSDYIIDVTLTRELRSLALGSSAQQTNEELIKNVLAETQEASLIVSAGIIIALIPNLITNFKIYYSDIGNGALNVYLALFAMLNILMLITFMSVLGRIIKLYIVIRDMSVKTENADTYTFTFNRNLNVVNIPKMIVGFMLYIFIVNLLNSLSDVMKISLPEGFTQKIYAIFISLVLSCDLRNVICTTLIYLAWLAIFLYPFVKVYRARKMVLTFNR